MAVKYKLFLLSCFLSLGMSAQVRVQVEENPQHAFHKTIPAGNYSGIAWLGGDRYAVVSDKSSEDGFFVFEVKVDSLSGEVLSARNLGFRTSGQPNRDDEGIAFNPSTQKVYISGEQDNRILEYGLDGGLTTREVELPDCYRHLPGNQGLEALSYNDHTGMLWTCNETDSIVITSFSADSLKPVKQYTYKLDEPRYSASKALIYAYGVGTLCALDDGSLLVLEREAYVSRSKLNSKVACKLYHYDPEPGAQKHLLAQWTTRFSLSQRSFANYEGMCLGPMLADGSRVLILVADSQNRYKGVLKDWLKSFKVRILTE